MTQAINQYFEGTLQLRNPSKGVLDFIDASLIKSKVSVAKTIRHKNGMDMYLSSNKFVLKLAKQLHDRFGSTNKISRKIFTRDKQTSKEVYRLTVLTEFPMITKGDVVRFQTGIVHVSSVTKKVTGVNLSTGKKCSTKYTKDLKPLKKHKTTVSKVWPSLEVLHPETYQSVRTENTKKVSLGEKVSVVISDGVWVV